MRPGPARAFPRRARNGHWFHHSRTNTGESYLRWGRLFEFLVSADGRNIRYRLLERTSRESLSTYLLGQALSFSLIARGIDPLHGTAVAVNGGAVVLLGDCGAGKSTLGAAMLARGFPIVTDDLVAIERRGGEYRVHPGPARVKLFPGVARKLVPGRRGTPMVRGTSKLILPLEPAEIAGGPLPVRAFYVLATGQRGPVRVEPLDPGPACVELVRGAFNLSVTDRKRLANQFQFVTRLARTVPVRRLTYPRAWTVLPTVVDAVLADLRTVQPSSRPAV